MATLTQHPNRQHYDVIIIGGAIMGASTAWFLSDNADFNGTTLVVERDPSYEFCSTSHTTSCMRQQFSTELNIHISQFAADYIKNMQTYMGGDKRVPNLKIQNFGYMYLANTKEFAQTLCANQQVQLNAGAATELLSPQEIKARYPFYNVDDIELGSINLKDEGYWEVGTVFQWWRKTAQERGVEYIHNEVVAMDKSHDGTKVSSLILKSGDVISAAHIVNATGPRASATAKMLGIPLPVEPRKRFSWIFKAQSPLDRELPLTIDPNGVHVRENGGGTYQCGGHGAYDPAVAYDDFEMDQELWQNHIWPTLAHRIPQFEAIKLTHEWAGHYAYNTFDHNAVIGTHPIITNFYFLNGFSGHGIQQSPAMGRGIAELITYGEYRTLDLTPFSFERILLDNPILEQAII